MIAYKQLRIAAADQRQKKNSICSISQLGEIAGEKDDRYGRELL